MDDTSCITFAAVARPFADSILVKRELLDHAALSPRQQDRIRDAISDDLRNLCNVAVPDVRRPEVSLEAFRVALGLDVDLCRQAWHGQPRFDPGRVTFHLEYVEPIHSLRARCLESATAEEMVALLDKHVRVAWILRDEDDRLTSLGFHTHRPDPDFAYRIAGIDLVECHPV